MPRQKQNYQKKLIAADPIVWLSLRHMADRLGCSVNDLARLAMMQLLIRHWDPMTLSLFPNEFQLQQLLDAIHEYNKDIQSIDHLRNYIIHKLNGILDIIQSKAEQKSNKYQI
ncbi:MAG: hypothetical protein DRI01_10005 [Chloroflexi bacterium]|nr:MAG: hypothetical protein DRI01_10005 [Chloroflexota bacterium]